MGSRLNGFQLSLCLLAAVPAACGGGGGGGSSALPAVPAAVTPPGAGGSSSAPAAVAFTIAVPGATSSSSTARRLRYVSAATKSVAVTANGTRQVADCAATCSMTLLVTPGAVTFSANLYDAAAGSGNLLATGQTTATVAAGQQNAVKVAFGGVVAKVALALGTSTVAAGTPATVPVTVSAQDAAGFTIVGPEPYASPVTLTTDDRSGAIALSTTSVTAPSAGVTLAYNGSTAVTAAHVSASVPGTAVSAATATVTISAKDVPPAPSGNVPSHATTWYYYGLNQVNQTIPAAWMAAHADYVEDDGYAAQHAEAFKDAGGKYAVSYTDPAYVPYCYAPFVAPVKACDGPIGNKLADESAWFHDASGGRVHRFVSAEFQYQEALNPGSQSARDAYRAYTQSLISAAPKVDYFLADDMGGTYIGPDGTQLGGWFWGFNAPAVETTSDAQFVPAAQAMLAAAVRPVLVNGYDPGTRLPSYNGKWLDSPNVVGDEYENCYTAAYDGAVAGDARSQWTGESNGMLAVIAHHSKPLCMMTAGATPSNRVYLMASWWMTYAEGYSIAAPERPSSDGFTVRQEYDIVPRQPRTTATTDVGALRSSTGAYVREFAACYQAGSSIGPCAAVVNPGASAVSMPALAGSYSHALVIDDKSAYTGGQASWTGAVPAQLPAVSAVILR